jgi:hypothetical protein
MNRRARVWRRFVGGLCAATLMLQVGCYSYRPLQTNVPAAGQRIAVVLNDRGRVLVGDRLGPAVDKVDGLLVEAGDAGVTLEVYRTLDLKGSAASWTGERVQVPKDGISGYQEREFSKRRTTLLTVAIVGGIAASLLMANLNVLGDLFSRDNSGGGSPTGESR